MRVRRIGLWALGAVGLLAGLVAYVALFRNCLTDDAFITLQYARNLIEHGVWGFSPRVPANTATSPLNVLLTALVSKVTGRDPLQAALVLAAGEYWLICLVLVRTSRLLFGRPYFGIVAFSALVFNPLLVSTLGLESVLFTLLLVAALYCSAARRHVALGVSLGLLILARPDGVLLVPLALTGIGTWRRRVVCASVMVAVMLPWLAYSRISLGAFLPDTLWIKVLQRPWQGHSFATGLSLFWQYYPVAVVFSFALMPFGVLLVRGALPAVRRYTWPIAVLVVAHFVAYSVLVVPPYHWYYVPTVVGGTLLGALGLATASERLRAGRAGWARVAIAVIPAVFPLAVLLPVVQQRTLAPAEMPIHTNWATAAQYREIGQWLDENLPPTADILLVGEIGTIAYYAQRRITDVYNTRDWLLQDLPRRVRRSTAQRVLLDADLGVLPVDARPHATHYLVMRNASEPFLRPPLQEWSIHSRWVPSGRVGLFLAP